MVTGVPNSLGILATFNTKPFLLILCFVCVFRTKRIFEKTLIVDILPLVFFFCEQTVLKRLDGLIRGFVSPFRIFSR